jgi:hypothetical protein
LIHHALVYRHPLSSLAPAAIAGVHRRRVAIKVTMFVTMVAER